MDKQEDNYKKPGRGGFSGRRGFYGNSRGYNSKNFGDKTWTFYNHEEWNRFQEWIKEEKEKEKKKDTVLILKGIEDMLNKRLKSSNSKGKNKEKDPFTSEEDTSSADDESDRWDSENNNKKKYDSAKEKKRKKTPKSKYWKEKKKETKKESKEEKLVFLSLERMERKLLLMEEENRNLQREISLLKENQRPEPIIDYRNSSIEAEELGVIENNLEDGDDKLREVQRKYKGRTGTAELKKWCVRNEVPYKNKDNALMAVIAHESQNL